MKSLSRLLLFAAFLPPSLPAALTLDEALARTAAQHPRLLAQAARVEAASAAAERAGYAPNPVLNVTFENFAGTGVARGADILEGTVEYAQTIERGGKRARRTAVAAAEREIASGEASVTRAALTGTAARDYLAAVIATQRLAIARSLADVARAAVQDADARHAAGDAPATEPARAQAALAIVLAEVARREAAVTQARSALAANWDGEPDEAIPQDTALHLPETLPDAATWRAQLAAHPRVALEQARLAGHRAAIDLAQANATPDIDVAAGVRYLNENSDAALVAGFSVPLPVRHRNQAGIRAAQQSLATAEYEAGAASRELRAGFSAAWQDLVAAHAAARQLRDLALPAATKSTTLLRRARDASQASQSEIFEAERIEGNLRRELLDQEAAFADALVRLETLIDPTFRATRQLLSQPAAS
jgi:cobalt-zinc-cadmium efflux system outer membrane protein